MFWFFGDPKIMIALLACLLLSVVASARVRSTYAKFDKVRIRSGLTGFETARRLLAFKGADDIKIGKVNGQLTDHYHPAKRIVNLSESTYDSSSVASVAVAAHEIGHVVQKKEGYLFYNLRTALVPITNFGSMLAMPLVLIGILMNVYVSSAGNSDLGFYVAIVGVILYGTSFLFHLITLPVELNASRRAGEMLLEQGIVTPEEFPGAKKVLSAAAMTYLVGTLTSLVYFLRFLLYVLSIFGRRNSRRF
ncbi:MAG: zinc metallopeptidase [Ruminococcaceae bacterium]|nr:zinc metallopeptidase [Oscillospiraceae bacterium]